MRTSGAWWWAAKRDLILGLRDVGDLLLVLAFFVLVTGLFPLALGADSKLLTRVGAGVFWVAALLAALLSLNRVFVQDLRDGALEQIAVSGASLTAIVAGKIFAHWLLTGLPLVLFSPLLALQFDLGVAATAVLMASLALGTPTLSLVGSVCAALTLSTRGGGTLLALITLPLFIPVLIFGAGAVEAVQAGLAADAHLSLLAAALTAALALCPLGAALAVKIALE
jgi:heme exporter protein B